MLASGVLATATPAVAAGPHGPGAVRVAPGRWGRPGQARSLHAAGGGRPSAGVLPGAPLVPQPGTSSELEGVFCLTSSDCWAVGSYQAASGAGLNQALRWNGSTWAQVSTPNPGGTASGSSSVLYGVRCKAANDCWAVGKYVKKGANLDQALHWNGTSWSKKAIPNPAGTADTDFNILIWVHCNSVDNCWAVGDTQQPTEPIVNQALRWNGTKWSIG